MTGIETSGSSNPRGETTFELRMSTAEEKSTEALIAAVGAAVRAARSRRGVTRKNLARHASISERYLTELEAGRANASLSVVHRVAQALGLSITDLIPGRSSNAEAITAHIETLQPQRQKRVLDLIDQAAVSKPPQRPCGVALIGLRGAGKTTLGRQLSTAIGADFIRLREVIERIAGQSVDELVSLAGQRAYRRLEHQALEETIAKCTRDDAVYSTSQIVLEVGGSLVTEQPTYGLLLENFFTVWLRADPDDHLQRVVEQGDRRPMAGSRDAVQDIKLMLDEREAAYQRAHLHIDTHGRTLQACSQLLEKSTQNWVRIKGDRRSR